MILKIVDKKDNKYYLENEQKEKYEHSFKFFDLPKMPEIGDFIKINEALLDKKFKEYSDLYLFGPLNQPYGRNVKSKNEIDVILLIIDDKQFYLKRFFG